ncbi:MAG: hypothetical protein R2741_08320 [Methanolobus sp.]
MTPPDGIEGGAMGMPPGVEGSSASVDTGIGAYVLTDGEELSEGTYTSTNDDENAIRAEGEVIATLNDVTVEKTEGSASSSDASSFYGLNSAILGTEMQSCTLMAVQLQLQLKVPMVFLHMMVQQFTLKILKLL